MKTGCSTVLALGAVILFAVPAADAEPKSKYGKFKDGVGNCIFSGEKLPFDKESTYTGLNTSFIAEETPTVYARCYFPETLDELSKHGKLFNSLRDKKSWVAWLKQGGFGGEMVRNVKFTFDAKKADQSQQYFWFCDGKNCDLKKDMRQRMLFKYKSLAKSYKKDQAKLPFKEKFCVQVIYERADTYKDAVRRVLDIKSAPIAEGCFEYVLTKAE